MILQTWNEIGLGALNNLTQYDFISRIAYFFADAPIFFIPVFLLGYWIYAGIRKDVEAKKSLLYIFYGCALAISISLCIQQFVHLERPEEYIKQTGKLLLSHIPDASFPSDHASVSFAFATGLYLFGFRRTFWSILSFILLMNISRIIAGVHWPFDIFAGMLVGISAASIIRYGVTKIKLVKKLNSLIIHILHTIKL